MTTLKQILKDTFEKQARNWNDMYAVEKAINKEGLGCDLECGHCDIDTMNALNSLIRKTDDTEMKELAGKLHDLIKTEQFLAP